MSTAAILGLGCVRSVIEQAAAGSLPICVIAVAAQAAAAAVCQQQPGDASFASKMMSLSGGTGDQVLDALLAMQLPATAATTAAAFVRVLVALASVCVLQEHLLKRLLADSGHGHLLERACTLANHIATHLDVAAAALSKLSGLPPGK